MQPKSGGSGDCHVANHPGENQDVTEEAVLHGQVGRAKYILGVRKEKITRVKQRFDPYLDPHFLSLSWSDPVSL